MKTYIWKLPLIAIVFAVLGLHPASAQEYIYTEGDPNLNNNWNDALNWSPNGIPNTAGVTATLTYPGGNLGDPLTVTVNGVGGSVTVGTLNIGTSDGVAGGIYTLNNDSNGDTITLNNNGAGAQINEVSGSVGDTIDVPLIIADSGGLTITDSSTAVPTPATVGPPATPAITAQFTINGGITGTGNLTINNNSANTTGTAILINGIINNVGTLSFDSTTVSSTVTAPANTDAIRDNAAIGSNVTSIIQNGASLVHLVGGQTISGTETYVNNGTANLSVAQNNITGTGNIILENNTTLAGGVDLSGAGAQENITGTITSEGTGTGVSNLGGIGSGVTSVTVAAGAMSGIRFNSGTITVNSGGTTLVDNSNSAGIQAVGGSTGTGNLIMENNGTNSIALDQQTYNNTGEIINEGTGTGTDGINGANPTLGANVTAVVEDSATSTFDIRLGSSTFTGTYEIQAGTMSLDGGNFYTTGSFLVGDTAADGTGSFLNFNINGNLFTTGATQTFSGFGTVEGNSVATVSGATIAPGVVGHIGKLTFTDSVTLAGGTNLNFILGAATASPVTSLSSLLGVGGTLTLTSGINLNLADNAGADGNGSLGVGVYDLITYGSLAGASAGDITSLFDITGPNGFTYDITDTGLGAGQIDLTVGEAVPEPGTWALMLGGLGMLLGWQRLRSRRA